MSHTRRRHGPRTLGGGAAALLAMALMACDPPVRIECPADQVEDVARAIGLVYQHRVELFERMTYLSGSQDKLRRNWNDIRVRCADDDRSKCGRATVLARADGWGEDLFLCFQNVAAVGGICRLAGVLVHEKAHTDKVPAWPGHSHADPPGIVSGFDPIYRAEEDTKEACKLEWELTTDELELAWHRPKPALSGDQ